MSRDNLAQFRLIYQEDIVNALTAAHGTMLATGGNGEFARGFIAALAAIALAFGIRSNSYVGMFQKQLKEEGEQYA